MRQEPLLIGGVIAGTLALIVGMAFFGARPRQPVEDVLAACVQHDGLGMHIHPHLTIMIDGEQRKIPANIGVTNTCMRPVHTHDETGKLHLEFPVEQDVKLSEFFRVWQQPFSRTEILDRKIGDSDVVKITVNGQETSEVENIMMRDEEQIVIEVKKKE